MNLFHWPLGGLAGLAVGMVLFDILQVTLPEYAGLWIGIPFVSTYIGWNWPEKENGGNSESVR